MLDPNTHKMNQNVYYGALENGQLYLLGNILILTRPKLHVKHIVFYSNFPTHLKPIAIYFQSNKYDETKSDIGEQNLH